jgi:hypothetical protein
MRDRERILSSLEGVYREAFEAAETRSDAASAQRLDFEFQRDQIHLEVLLDLRDLLLTTDAPEPSSAGGAVSDLIDKAQAIRRFTRPK